MAKKPKIEASSVGVAIDVVKATAPALFSGVFPAERFEQPDWKAIQAECDARGIDPVIMAIYADPDRERRNQERKAWLASRPIEETISYQRQKHYRRQIVFSITIPIFKWKLSIEMRQRNPEPFKNPLD